MSKRAKNWARKARKALLLELGGCCVRCGGTESLCFDCIVPMHSYHHAWSTDKRMTFYRRQHKAGNLQILCSRCNGRKGILEDKKFYEDISPY